MALLEVRNVHRSFGGLQALKEVTFDVAAGQVKAVIGPNGAGKTTLFNVISGMLPADGGDVVFNGTRISGLRAHQIGRLGVSRTFQNLSLFNNMTVLENVMVGRHCRTHGGIVAAALRLPHQQREERGIRDDARRYLDQVGMADRADVPISALSFGQRRAVELARALATEPRLLLLDEPASGLNTKESLDLAGLILRIRDSGVTILLVEHDMSLVMDISDDILVLYHGQPMAEGPPATVRADPQVIAIYLGGDSQGVAP